MSGARASLEYRVRWRRTSWAATSANKTRRFTRRYDLDRFIERLEDYDRGAELVYSVHTRQVGPWVIDE